MVDQGDCAATPTQIRRRWWIVGLLICANTAFALLFNPNGGSDEYLSEWLGMLLMGAVLAQPMLFGIWAALGTGLLVKRVPLTLAALIVVGFCGGIKQWNVFMPAGAANSLDVEMSVLNLALF